ncbi:hypothetical protein [Plasmodium yoelii yoelii]|uniref:Uncharacterized protein n=1 Tax=Plasmodium yoelii yoelii TaxID=73239 RepID=Q7R8C3_PLAYO|nr:hypothetical protein [Plasmodium yoelii yoelii]
MSIQHYDSLNISKRFPNKYHKNVLFLLCFFIHIKDKFSLFINNISNRNCKDNGNITSNSFDHLNLVKHYVKDSNYYINQFNNNIKYTYGYLNNSNYNLDLLYEWKSYGFFFQNYINNTLIMLSQNNNNKFININKNFSILLGYNYVFINNIYLKKENIYNYIACSLSSNISFYFFDANNFKEDIVKILQDQICKINNYLKNGKKFININNHEYTLNKKPLIYISLEKNVFPLSSFALNTKSSNNEFTDINHVPPLQLPAPPRTRRCTLGSFTVASVDPVFVAS